MIALDLAGICRFTRRAGGLGGPAILRSISAGIIIRIRYYKEPGIPIAYGRNNPGGVIEVTTIG